MPRPLEKHSDNPGPEIPRSPNNEVTDFYRPQRRQEESHPDTETRTSDLQEPHTLSLDDLRSRRASIEQLSTSQINRSLAVLDSERDQINRSLETSILSDSEIVDRISQVRDIKLRDELLDIVDKQVNDIRKSATDRLSAINDKKEFFLDVLRGRNERGELGQEEQNKYSMQRRAVLRYKQNLEVRAMEERHENELVEICKTNRTKDKSLERMNRYQLRLELNMVKIEILATYAPDSVAKRTKEIKELKERHQAETGSDLWGS